MSDNTSSRYEFELISQIADRAEPMFRRAGNNIKRMTLIMDLDSAHQQFSLKLAELLAADDMNFSHDVGGIVRHMDRSQYPGKVGQGFVPRYAMDQQ